MNKHCWLLIWQCNFLILSDFKYTLHKYLPAFYIFAPNFKHSPPLLCPSGISVPHKGRTIQIAGENTTTPYINHKDTRNFVLGGNGGEVQVIRLTLGPIFNIKYFCISFRFLEGGNNIQTWWAWAVSFEQHSLNAITLPINMLQHKLREDIPMV